MVQVHEQHALPHARNLRYGGRTPDADQILVRAPTRPACPCDAQCLHRMRREVLMHCSFHSNRGNLAGALMVTAGAVAVVKNNTFLRVGHDPRPAPPARVATVPA